MKKKFGFERNFSPPVGQVPDLPKLKPSPDLHQFFPYFGLFLAFSKTPPFAFFITFHHICALFAHSYFPPPHDQCILRPSESHKETPRQMRRSLIICCL